MTSKEEQPATETTAEVQKKVTEEVVTFEIAGDKGTSADITLKFNDDLSGANLQWKGEDLATIERGNTALSPKASLAKTSKLTGDDATNAIVHAQKWLDDYIAGNLKSLVLMDGEINNSTAPENDAAPLTGAIKDIASSLLDNLGIMDRALVEDKLKAVSTEDRKGLWRFKIKIGASSIFIPYILKPAPTQLRLMLWALNKKIKTLPTPPTPGMVWVDMEKGTLPEFYRLSGYSPAGNKAVRVDMVERLADAVRPLGLKGASFEVSPETMGLVGLSGDDFAKVMNAIGYQSRKHKKQEEGKEEAEFYTFAWQGAKKPATPKPQVKKAKPQNKKPHGKKLAPKKEFVMDPNSPFAALTVLKNSMKKSKKG